MLITNTWPGLVWAMVILGLCAIPGSDLPVVSWADLLLLDKLIHAFLWMVLFLLVFGGLFAKGMEFRKAMKYSLIFSVLYGGATEIMQQVLFEERTADIFDFAANTLGALLGMVVVIFTRNKTSLWIQKNN